jgi:hypothetical protein
LGNPDIAKNWNSLITNNIEDKMIYEDRVTIEGLPEVLKKLPKRSDRAGERYAFVFPYTQQDLGEKEKKELAYLVASLAEKIE